MKAPAFAYAKPTTLEETFALLDRHGADAKLLAGGQSLLATLNMRLSAPDMLIDITGLPELSGLSVTDNTLRIGALTKHVEIERSPLIAEHAPLLAQAVPHIAHVAIRNAGTLGGSLAFADPAAEWPACCVALDATFVIASKSAERRVRAREFFRGLYDTVLLANEILSAIEIPILGPAYRSAFQELARRQGDYAIVGICAVAKLNANILTEVRLSFLGMGQTPMLAQHAMNAMEGKACSTDTIAAAQAALANDLDPSADLYSSPATKMHLARVLTGRVLTALSA